MGGMLAATSFGVFVIPVLFILIIKLSYGKKKLAELRAKAAESGHGQNL
jgi:HAE1 family hydrophobic/amphiphilic exporter-1